MADWTTLSKQETAALLTSKGSKRVREHDFNKRRVAHWPYCQQCGLVMLKNDISRKAAKAKCVTYE